MSQHPLDAPMPALPLPLPLLIFLAFLAANGLGYLLIFLDKRRAQRGSWRIKEGTLLLPVVFGGGIGAFVAMNKFRHKTRKGSFRVAYWMCVLLSTAGYGLLLFRASL